jgi:hypothetical protein
MNHNIIIILLIIFLALIYHRKKIEPYNPTDYYYPQYLMGYNLNSYFKSPPNWHVLMGKRPINDIKFRFLYPPKLDSHCYHRKMAMRYHPDVALHTCTKPAGALPYDYS